MGKMKLNESREGTEMKTGAECNDMAIMSSAEDELNSSPKKGIKRREQKWKHFTTNNMINASNTDKTQ